MHERSRAPLRSIRPARAMRRGFAESNWRKAIMPSSNACSKIVTGLAEPAGESLKRTGCKARARYDSCVRDARIVTPANITDSSYRTQFMRQGMTLLHFRYGLVR